MKLSKIKRIVLISLFNATWSILGFLHIGYGNLIIIPLFYFLIYCQGFVFNNSFDAFISGFFGHLFFDICAAIPNPICIVFWISSGISVLFVFYAKNSKLYLKLSPIILFLNTFIASYWFIFLFFYNEKDKVLNYSYYLAFYGFGSIMLVFGNFFLAKYLFNFFKKYLLKELT